MTFIFIVYYRTFVLVNDEMVAKKQANGRCEGVGQTRFISDLLYYDSINHYFLQKTDGLEVSCEELWVEKKNGGLILLVRDLAIGLARNKATAPVYVA